MARYVFVFFLAFSPFLSFSLSLFLFLFVLFVCFVFEYDCDLDSPSTSHSRARQHNGSHCLHFTCTRVARMMFYFSCQRTDPRIWLLLLALGPKIRFEQDSEKFCLVSFSFLVSFPFRVEMFARFARGCWFRLQPQSGLFPNDFRPTEIVLIAWLSFVLFPLPSSMRCVKGGRRDLSRLWILKEQHKNFPL